MKRTMRAIAALLALILTLSACGQAPAVETAAPTTEVPTEAPTEAPAAEEYTEPIPDGHNQVVFYWNYPGSYETCDMWIWLPEKDGKGYTFHECEYGGKGIVNVPEGVEQVGFIVRRDCSDPGGTSWGSATKDYDQDRFAKVEGKQTVIYLKTGDPGQYFSNDGGKTLDMAKKFTMVSLADRNKLAYKLTPKTMISDAAQVKVLEDGKEVAVTAVSTLGKEATSGYIELAQDLDLSKTGVKDLAPLGALTSLKNLSAASNQISSLTGIEKLTALTSLDLSEKYEDKPTGIAKDSLFPQSEKEA